MTNTTNKERAMSTTITIKDQLVKLGTLTNNKGVTAQRKGVLSINKYFESFEGTVDDKLTTLVLHYLTDIQVRDYTMGILDIRNKDTMTDALKYLVAAAPVDSEFINAPASLLAVQLYEHGDTQGAHESLDKVRGNYSLNLLLRRVIVAGWPPSTFVAMRLELHPEVVKGIFGKIPVFKPSK